MALGTNPEDGAAVLLRLLTLLEGHPPCGSPASHRRRLTEWLTVRPTTEIPAEAWPLLEAVWRIEALETPVQSAAGLDPLSSNGRWTDAVSLWRGDITRLQVDAIVNAANSGLTGCYLPFHDCVDNAIHTAAGPRLRQACEAIMAARGRPEPVATATMTPGFSLPAKHVLHTVGPMVHAGAPSPEDRRALAGCYHSCLQAARAAQLGSIAFCAISTGVFGYPKDAAARVALAAIRKSLASEAGGLHVVLVAFCEADEAVYRRALLEAMA